MRKVVFGKTIYDSENASLVYRPSGELSSLREEQIQDMFELEDLHWFSDEALYITPEGRFFVFGGGGMSQEVLKPLDTLKAGEWIKSEMNRLVKLLKPDSTNSELLELMMNRALKELKEKHPELRLH